MKTDDALDLGFFRGAAVVLQVLSLNNPILAASIYRRILENERFRNGRALAERLEQEGIINESR